MVTPGRRVASRWSASVSAVALAAATTANGAVTLGAEGSRITPSFERVEDLVLLLAFLAAGVVAYAARAEPPREIAKAIGIQLVIALAGAGLVGATSGGPFFSAMSYEGPAPGAARAAYLFSNRSGCYEVFVAEPWSIRMRRVGHFDQLQSHGPVVITWAEDGEPTRAGRPLLRGACKDWL